MLEEFEILYTIRARIIMAQIMAPLKIYKQTVKYNSKWKAALRLKVI